MEKIVINFNRMKWNVYQRDEADRSVAAEIFKWREYRAAEETIKNASDPILDAGAHSGLFTLYARALNPAVHIIALEPEPNNLELMRQHLKENGIEGVTLVPGALAGQSIPRPLALSDDSHNHRLAEKKTGKAFITVEGISFSDLCARCRVSRFSLVKMDIEGGEYEVINSMDKKDFKKMGTVIMEYHNFGDKKYHQIEDQLRKNGFSVQIFPSQFDSTMGFLRGRNKRYESSSLDRHR